MPTFETEIEVLAKVKVTYNYFQGAPGGPDSPWIEVEYHITDAQAEILESFYRDALSINPDILKAMEKHHEKLLADEAERMAEIEIDRRAEEDC